jgi:hypothetical protein
VTPFLSLSQYSPTGRVRQGGAALGAGWSGGRRRRVSLWGVGVRVMGGWVEGREGGAPKLERVRGGGRDAPAPSASAGTEPVPSLPHPILPTRARQRGRRPPGGGRGGRRTAARRRCAGWRRPAFFSFLARRGDEELLCGGGQVSHAGTATSCVSACVLSSQAGDVEKGEGE